MSKIHYTYIVTYDIKEDENNIVRDNFRNKLIATFQATMLSESTYAFSSTNGVSKIKSTIISSYDSAYKDNNKTPNTEDKVWLVCADKKADPNTQNPYELACYKLNFKKN